MVSVTDDGLRRQQTFTLDIYNFQLVSTHSLNQFLDWSKPCSPGSRNYGWPLAPTFWRRTSKTWLNSAGEAKRKRLHKYKLALKTGSPGEVNRPVLQRQLGVVENSCENIKISAVRSLADICFLHVLYLVFSLCFTMRCCKLRNRR